MWQGAFWAEWVSQYNNEYGGSVIIVYGGSVKYLLVSFQSDFSTS